MHWDLIETITGLNNRKIGFKSIIEAIDTTTSGGKLIFHIFGALAEFERDIIKERTQAGLTAARARGRRDGRPKSLTPKKAQMAEALYKDKNNTIDEICKTLNVSRATFTAMSKLNSLGIRKVWRCNLTSGNSAGEGALRHTGCSDCREGRPDVADPGYDRGRSHGTAHRRGPGRDGAGVHGAVQSRPAPGAGALPRCRPRRKNSIVWSPPTVARPTASPTGSNTTAPKASPSSPCRSRAGGACVPPTPSSGPSSRRSNAAPARSASSPTAMPCSASPPPSSSKSTRTGQPRTASISTGTAHMPDRAPTSKFQTSGCSIRWTGWKLTLLREVCA